MATDQADEPERVDCRVLLGDVVPVTGRGQLRALLSASITVAGIEFLVFGLQVVAVGPAPYPWAIRTPHHKAANGMLVPSLVLEPALLDEIANQYRERTSGEPWPDAGNAETAPLVGLIRADRAPIGSALGAMYTLPGPRPSSVRKRHEPGQWEALQICKPSSQEREEGRGNFPACQTG